MSIKILIQSIKECKPYRVNLFTNCDHQRFEILPSHITMLHMSDLTPDLELVSAILDSDVNEFTVNDERFTKGLLDDFERIPDVHDCFSFRRKKN